MPLLRFLVSRLLVLLGLAVGICGQLIQVDVGLQGSFYNPGSVAAGLNDIVTFVFSGDEHDVTQSSFDTPCVPLPGGFSSGITGRGSALSGPSPIWNLTVTNVTGPLWFFCAATEPLFHCAEGMVGVINPPSQDMYTSFIEAARSTNPTSTVAVSFVATGQGAFATNSPALTSTSISLLPTITAPASEPIATVTAPATVNDNDVESHLGAIIGGSIGGAAAIAAFIIIVILLRRTSLRRGGLAVAPYDTTRVYDRYDGGMSPPLTDVSEKSAAKVERSGWVEEPVGYAHAHPRQAVPKKHSAGTLQPLRKPSIEQTMQAEVPTTQSTRSRHPYAAYHSPEDRDEEEVLTVDHSPSMVESSGRSATDADITLGVLAKEVAKVLRQASRGGGETIRAEKGNGREEAQRGTGESRPSGQKNREPLNLRDTAAEDTLDESEMTENLSRESHSTAPPIYRSVQWELKGRK